MLSGRRKKDYAAEGLAAQVLAMEIEQVEGNGDADDDDSAILAASDPEADELEVAAVA